MFTTFVVPASTSCVNFASVTNLRGISSACPHFHQQQIGLLQQSARRGWWPADRSASVGAASGGPTGSAEEEIRSHLRRHSKQVTLVSDPAANLVQTLFACFPLLARWSPSIPLGDALSGIWQWCAAIASFGSSWWSHHTANIHQDFRPSWVYGLWTDCMERSPSILEKQRSGSHSLQI